MPTIVATSSLTITARGLRFGEFRESTCRRCTFCAVLACPKRSTKKYPYIIAIWNRDDVKMCLQTRASES